MPTYFQKPENALKRAGEFIEVAKPQQALDVLYDVIKSKRHRTWQKTHEPIMLRYLDLCVELKKSHLAKEGLYQYKNICQNVNVKSLDTVIRYYLELASTKTEEARAESQQTCLDVDDLDVIQTPESLLLAAVTAEDAQDRSDRAILTPWVKFLWESYRQCLDLLRNNNRVEKLYHDIAKQAFDFCLKYTRKTEFRKLCDNLRNHLKQIVEKTHNPQNAVSLSNPDSLYLHLETRLAQLDSAIAMELWQEAFKAVEDIHDLIVRSKKVPKPSMLANYFENVSLVFLKSGNRLFHAAACHKMFLLISEQKKNPSQEEITKMANRVVCATLAIPIPPTRYSIDQLLESNDTEKRRRLASLLSLSAPPTRASLVKDLIRNNVIQHLSPELKPLYSSLEVEFDPLNLYKKMKPCVEFAGQQEALMKYVDLLQEMTVIRLVKQVAQIYQCIEFARLRQLLPFVSAFELERIVVQAAKNIDLPVRLDHRKQTVSFGTDLNMALQEDVEEGPFLQHMPGEQLRNQLQHMAKALSRAITKLGATDAEQAENQNLKVKIIDAYRKTEKKDREKILKRKNIIENRKEELEVISREKDAEEMQKEKEKQKGLRDAEEERLKREMAEREKQRAQQEHENIRKKEAEKRIEQLKTTDIGIRALEGLTQEELAELDTDDILQKQVEQLEKEKRELQERLKSQDKKVDYFIRAKRLEEIPLLEAHAAETAVTKRDNWEKLEADRIEGLKSERELAMKHRDRLRRMLPDKEEFIQSIRDTRQGVYQDKLETFSKLLAETRSVRLAERRAQRKEERKTKAIQAREEKKQREQDEAIRKEREERLAREREENEARQKVEEERLAKLEAIAQKQRQKDQEIEARLAAKSEGGESGRVPFKPREGAGGWREREAAKAGSFMKKTGDEVDGRDSGPAFRGGDREESRRDIRGESQRGGDDRWGRDEGPAQRRDDGPRRDFRDDGPRRGGDDRWGRDERPQGRDGYREDRGGGYRGGQDRDREEGGGRWGRGGGGGADDSDRWSRGADTGRDSGRTRGGEDFGRRGGERDDFRRRDDNRDSNRDNRDYGDRRRDDRGFGGRDDRGGPRRGGEDGGDSPWRRGGAPQDSGPRRDAPRGPPPSRGSDDRWQRGGQRNDDRSKNQDSDGWQTVRR